MYAYTRLLVFNLFGQKRYQVETYLYIYFKYSFRGYTTVLLRILILIVFLKRPRDFLLCTKKETNCVLFTR